MTLLFAEGFETVVDHIDMLARGLVQNGTLTQNSSTTTLAVASRTGFPGKGLQLRSSAVGYSTSAVYPLGGGGYPDFGMIPMGQSIYSLWQSGGFSVGFSGSFNTQNYVCVGVGESQQLVYDGSTYYWAACNYYNGSSWTWGLFYSTDLKNWYPPITQPSVNQNTTIMVYGSGPGALIVVGNSSNYSVPASQYSNNMGMSWTTVAGSAVNRTPMYVNQTNALILGAVSGSSIACTPYFSTAWNVAGTALSSVVILPPATYCGAFAKQIGPYYVCVGYSGSSAYQPAAGNTSGFGFCQTSADVTVAANWTVGGKLNNQIVDMIYFNGMFIAGGYGGLYYCTPSNPNWSISTSFFGVNAAQQNPQFTIFALACNSTMCVAVGLDPANNNTAAIFTSTDGIHWTKQNRFIFQNNNNGNTAQNAWTSVLWDGHQWIVCGGLYNGIVITSPDGFNWEVQQVWDNGEATGTGSLSFLGVYSGTMNYVSNVFSPWNAAGINTNLNGIGVAAAAAVAGQNPSLNTRQVGLITNTSANVPTLLVAAGASTTLPAPQFPVGVWPGSACTNYYELVFTAGATANTFTVQWAVNGVLMPYTSAVLAMAPVTDTTGVNQLFFNLPRNGNFVVVDDIYLTNFAGPNNIGRLGPQNIFGLLSTTAAQNQFSNTIGANSNPQTTGTELSNAEGYIYSGTLNAKDIYNTSNQVPSNFNVHAVQVDAFLGVQNLGLAVAGAVGVQQGTSSKAGTPAVPPAPNQTRASVLTEVDPKTNAAFTNAGLNTLQMTVTKTT